MCDYQTTSHYQDRPSPPYPANQCCGRMKRGNDDQLWISIPDKNGTCRWQKVNKNNRNRAYSPCSAVPKKASNRKSASLKKKAASRKRAASQKKAASRKKASSRKTPKKKSSRKQLSKEKLICHPLLICSTTHG